MNSKELERFIKIADQMMTDNEDVRLNAATRCYEMLVKHKMLWRDVIALIPNRLAGGETPEEREHRRVYGLGLSYGYQSGLFSAAPLNYAPPEPVRTEDVSLPAVFKEGVRDGYDDGFNDALRYGGYTKFSQRSQEPEHEPPQDVAVRKIMGIAGRVIETSATSGGVLVKLENDTQILTALYRGAGFPENTEGLHCVVRVVPGTPPVISHILAQYRDKAER